MKTKTENVEIEIDDITLTGDEDITIPRAIEAVTMETEKPGRVHKFESTGDAYDAVQVGQVPVGAILVVESEKVIGLADTWPVAITAEHGELHTVADGYSIHDKTFGFDSETIADAQLLALKQGWPIDPRSSSSFIRIPKKFFDDHESRDLDTPAIAFENYRHYWIRRDDPALAELLSDARHYAETFQGWTVDAHPYIHAARHLIRALKSQGVNA